MELYKLLNEKIDDADMVLVGIGFLLQYNWKLMEQNEKFSALVDQAGEDKDYDQLLSFLQGKLLNDLPDIELEQRYRQLCERLKGKNYFVVTTTIDDVIYGAGFDKERIVTPCGGFRKLQCCDNCSGELTDVDQIDWNTISKSYENGVLPQNYRKLLCPHCGKELVYNQVGTGTYCEQGYLDQWDIYTKWLMGTMHKKIVLLELGTGLEFPTIIRSPFEKMVTYNRSATLFRVHPVMNQLFLDNETMKRAYGIKEDVRKFILNWK